MMTFGTQGMGFQRVLGGCGGDLGVPVTSESLGGNLGEGVYIARDMIVRGQPRFIFHGRGVKGMNTISSFERPESQLSF